MQMSGDPAGLNSYQVTPNSWTKKKMDGSSMESIRVKLEMEVKLEVLMHHGQEQ